MEARRNRLPENNTKLSEAGKKTKALQVVKYNGNRMQSMETATATDSLYFQSTLCQLRHPDEPELKVTKVPRVKEAIQARAPFTSLVLKNTAPLAHHNSRHFRHLIYFLPFSGKILLSRNYCLLNLTLFVTASHDNRFSSGDKLK